MQLRGEAKTKTAPLVEALYGFDSGRSKRAITENRRIVEQLKEDKGFVFAVLVFLSLFFFISFWNNNNNIVVIRYFQTKMASVRGYTTTLSSKRP